MIPPQADIEKWLKAPEQPLNGPEGETVRSRSGINWDCFSLLSLFLLISPVAKNSYVRNKSKEDRRCFFLLIDSFSFLPPPTLHPPTHPSTELEMSIDLSKYEVLSIRTTTSPNFSFFFPFEAKTEVLKLQEKAKTCCIVCKTVIWKALNRIS